MLLIAVLAAALMARRLLEFQLMSRTLRQFAARRREIERVAAPDDEFPRVAILLPLYREHLVVEQLIRHVGALAYPRERLQVFCITTAKEPDGDPPSTRQRLNAMETTLRDLRIDHVHYGGPHDFRAEQMNFVVRQLLAGCPAAETYVGVYNADSLPDADTLRLLALDACAEKRRSGEFPAAYQQGIRYFVPQRRAAALTAHATAAFQTLFVFAHFLRRLQAARPGGPIAVTLAGHGEFIRLDALAAVGLFPAYAYADGLLLGWELAFAGFQIRVLPCCDHCEVPAGARSLLLQHKAWFIGLLNLRAARQRFGTGYVSADFCARRMVATLAWGLRGLFLAAMLLFAAALGWSALALAALAIVAYAAAPVAWLALATPALSTWAPGQHEPLPVSLTARMAASVPALLIDGAGFWPALWTKLSAGSATPVPAKTER